MLLDNKLFLAPIGPDPLKVLDIGTGTGIWAIDFADQYPSALVIGTDLSPIQPTYVPPNLQFEIDDAASEWTFPKNSFDFIHVRGLFGSLRDWPAFYRQVYDHLKPGGCYEQLECSVCCHADDDSTPEGSPLRRWGQLFTLAGERMGKPTDVLDRQRQWLVDGGFEGVVEKRFKMPTGLWPSAKTERGRKMKEIGSGRLISWLGMRTRRRPLRRFEVEEEIDMILQDWFGRLRLWLREDVLRAPHSDRWAITPASGRMRLRVLSGRDVRSELYLLARGIFLTGREIH